MACKPGWSGSLEGWYSRQFWGKGGLYLGWALAHLYSKASIHGKKTEPVGALRKASTGKRCLCVTCFYRSTGMDPSCLIMLCSNEGS